MWFKIQLTSYLPPISVLVGMDGMLFLKLVDIGILLGKKNAYSYKHSKSEYAVEAREVLPATGFLVGPKTLSIRVVPITVACQLLEHEDRNLAQLVCHRFGRGYAHKKGMRSFVTNERKAPLLECVDERDDRCVFIPEWIRDFVKDLTLLRQEVANSELPSTSTVSQLGKRKPVDSLQELNKRLCVDEAQSVKEERPSTMDDSPASPVPEEPPLEAIPKEPVTEEAVPEPIAEEAVPEPFTTEAGTSSSRKILAACLNMSDLNFSSTTSVFPQPGDLIIKFQTPPPRVIFVQGKEDDMYWMCRTRLQ